MQSGIDEGKHLGLSFGALSNGESSFWNYGQLNGKPINENNYFEMASIGKILTAALVLKLENQGLLSLTDFVEKHVQDFPIKNRVTIEHLLNHTSGLSLSPSNWISQAPKNSYVEYTLEMLKDDLKTVSISEERYGHFSYSNYGYILLGQVAKNITHQKVFSKLLKNEILTPLGLEEMHFHIDEDNIKNNFIIGHGPSLDPVKPYLDLGEVFSSTGALKTTVKELLNFAKILLGEADVHNDLKIPLGKLLNLSKDKSGNLISLGLHVRETDNGIAYFHAGSIAGNKCSFVLSRERNSAQAYISNTLNHVKILWGIFYS